MTKWKGKQTKTPSNENGNEEKVELTKWNATWSVALRFFGFVESSCSRTHHIHSVLSLLFLAQLSDQQLKTVCTWALHTRTRPIAMRFCICVTQEFSVSITITETKIKSNMRNQEPNPNENRQKDREVFLCITLYCGVEFTGSTYEKSIDKLQQLLLNQMCEILRNIDFFSSKYHKSATAPPMIPKTRMMCAMPMSPESCDGLCYLQRIFITVDVCHRCYQKRSFLRIQNTFCLFCINSFSLKQICFLRSKWPRKNSRYVYQVQK